MLSHALLELLFVRVCLWTNPYGPSGCGLSLCPELLCTPSPPIQTSSPCTHSDPISASRRSVIYIYISSLSDPRSHCTVSSKIIVSTKILPQSTVNRAQSGGISRHFSHALRFELENDGTAPCMKYGKGAFKCRG